MYAINLKFFLIISDRALILSGSLVMFTTHTTFSSPCDSTELIELYLKLTGYFLSLSSKSALDFLLLK